MPHRYKHGGFVKPSVTEIIGDSVPPGGLIQWAANKTVEWIKDSCHQDLSGYYSVDDDELNEARFAYKEYSKEAMNTGSAVHKFAEVFLNSGRLDGTIQDDYNEEQYKTACESFLLWYSCVDYFKPIENEFKVYGKYVGGTCDTVGTLLWHDKGIRVPTVYYIDFKSSMYVSRPSHGPQIAAYKDMDGRYLDAGVAMLHLDKDNVDFKWKDYTEDGFKMWSEYLYMEGLFMSRHPLIAKKAGWK